MLTIDGSYGEGGGQILRTSLALSLVTGTPFRIEHIRAGRPKPGLLRQHLTAVHAAAEVGQAQATGAAIGSLHLTFIPGRVTPGTYTFSVGTAASTSLKFSLALASAVYAPRPWQLRQCRRHSATLQQTLPWGSIWLTNCWCLWRWHAGARSHPAAVAAHDDQYADYPTVPRGEDRGGTAYRAIVAYHCAELTHRDRTFGIVVPYSSYTHFFHNRFGVVFPAEDRYPSDSTLHFPLSFQTRLAGGIREHSATLS